MADDDKRYMGFWIGHLYGGEQSRIRAGNLNPQEREMLAKGADPWAKFREPEQPQKSSAPPPNEPWSRTEYLQHKAEREANLPSSERSQSSLEKAAETMAQDRQFVSNVFKQAVDGLVEAKVRTARTEQAERKADMEEASKAALNESEDRAREGEFRDIQPSQISPEKKPPGVFDDIKPLSDSGSSEDEKARAVAHEINWGDTEERALRKREMEELNKLRGASLWPGTDGQHAGKMQLAFEGKPNSELPKPWHKHRDLVVGILLASGAAIMGLMLWLVSPNSTAKVVLALISFFVLLAFSLGLVVHYLEWKRRYASVGVLVSLLATAAFGSYVWPKPILEPALLPVTTSFVFVKPGVWINGDTWTFHIEHRGPEPVFNVELLFNDLGAKKDQALTFAEIDPGNIGLAKYFTWKPVVADHEHYDILISSRNVHIQQTLRVERISDQWRVATRVTDIDHKRVLIECRDAGFPMDQEWVNLSPCFPDYAQKY